MPEPNLILDWGKQRHLSGTVCLTGSKSESNRALLLEALSGGAVRVRHLSEADDTRLMSESLLKVRQSPETQTLPGTKFKIREIDVGPAGTVMRFMTAYLSVTPGEYLLRGNERMHERPIGVLVDALRQLGARITYKGQAGYPPLSISGGFEQIGGRIKVPGNISSQYLSALLLIAPTLPKGLHLQIDGALTSRPYLTMTLQMLAATGIRHTWEGDTISINPQTFAPSTLLVEPDWSAASYWYSLLALSESGEIMLPGLKESSLQGDRMIVPMMERFGIHSTFTVEGLHLRRGEPVDVNDAEEPLDFTECPDIAQTVIACAAATRSNMSFTGLHTLRIKETDRIQALQNEIEKFGVELIQDGQVFHLRTAGFFLPERLTFDTYGDHRMAMAFAPLAMKFGPLKINNPAVVEKSYPKFWVHLSSMGCALTYNN